MPNCIFDFISKKRRNKKISRQENKKGIVEVVDKLIKLFNLFLFFRFLFWLIIGSLFTLSYILYGLSFTQKIKTSLQAKRKIKLCRVFERKFFDLIIIQ
jgi:hypothetical protein